MPDRWFVVFAVAAMTIALGGCGSKLAVAPDRNGEPLMLLGHDPVASSPTANRCVAIPTSVPATMASSTTRHGGHRAMFVRGRQSTRRSMADSVSAPRTP